MRPKYFVWGFVFIISCLSFISLRNQWAVTMHKQALDQHIIAEGSKPAYAPSELIPESLPNSIRLGRHLLEWTINNLGYYLIVKLPHGNKVHQDFPGGNRSVRYNYFRVTAYFVLYPIMLLIPLLFFVDRFFKSTTLGAFFIFAVLLTVGGWGDYTNYQATDPLHLQDILSVSAFWLGLWFLTTWRFRMWPFLLLVVVAQICFEHLGLILCMGAVGACFSFYRSGRDKLGRSLEVLGLGGLTILGLTGALLCLAYSVNGVILFAGEGSPTAFWDLYGSHNNIKFVFDHMKFFLKRPIGIGIVFGIIILVAHRGFGVQLIVQKHAKRVLYVATGMSCGFLMALTAGFFVSGLQAEIGRQSMPFNQFAVLVAMVWTYMLGDRLIVSVRTYFSKSSTSDVEAVAGPSGNGQ